jgi:hypothetical protein
MWAFDLPKSLIWPHSQVRAKVENAVRNSKLTPQTGNKAHNGRVGGGPPRRAGSTRGAMTDANSSTAAEVVTAALLVIGDEILSGRTKDKNIGYIAEYLTAVGIDL